MLLELRTVNKFFRDYFQREERTIYLNHLKVKIGLDLAPASLLELRLLLARVPELMMVVDPRESRKVATAECVAVLNNPQLLSLLPATHPDDLKSFSDLLYYAAKYDNDAVYAEVLRSHLRPYNRETELRICLRYSALKCLDVLGEELLYTRENLIQRSIVAVCRLDGEKYTLALTLLIDYCSNQGSLEELLNRLSPNDAKALLKHPSKPCNKEAHLKLVAWVIDNLSEKAFWDNTIAYLIAAGASSKTVDRLSSKFLKTRREKLRLKKLFEEHVNRCESEKEDVSYGMCLPQDFPMVRQTMERAWR